MHRTAQACWNETYQHPKFQWDDSAKVPPEWKWGDAEPPPGPGEADWICKSALLLRWGSGFVEPVELPFTVTRFQGEQTLQVDQDGINPYDHLVQGDWIQVNGEQGRVLPKAKGGNPRNVLNELNKHTEAKQPNVVVQRRTVRPPSVGMKAIVVGVLLLYALPLLSQMALH